MKAKGLPFEIVFVSSDKDKASWSEYFGEMPWLALDYDMREAKEQLSKAFGVRGIPSLVFLDTDLSTITKEGRGVVDEDPEGNNFPWHPKPVRDFKAGPGPINGLPCVIALCESAGSKAQDEALKVLAPLAQAYIDDAKAKGEDEPELAFMIATSSGDISKQIRKLVKLPESAAESQPQLVLMDIPDEGGFYLGPKGDITEAAVRKFVGDFKTKALERKQLEQ